MVFLHFPQNYTDEEALLLAKYGKLRKKKKALEQMKIPNKPEPEKVNPLKRPLDPKDAKELAKKLIQSGKVALPMKQTIEKKLVFKRPRTLERKILSTGRSEGHGGITPGYNANYPVAEFSTLSFEPFTPTPMDPSANAHVARFKSPSSSPMKKKLKGEDGNSTENKGMKPKRGPTIYVSAQSISDDVLRDHFGKFGKIINVKVNNPTVGFVTYDKTDAAELAIQQMSGQTVDEISYEVQFARRQPNITQLINDASASASWSAMAASNTQKSSHQDRRAQVVYEEQP